MTNLAETAVDTGAVITSIETVALRAALEKEFRGSHYHMTPARHVGNTRPDVRGHSR